MGCALLGCTNDSSEKRFPEDLVLLSQEDIEDFTAQGYTKIDGSLTIGDYNEMSSSVESLVPLQQINEISGNLEIWNNAALESLAGLEGIKAISEMRIQSNRGLTNLEGLNNLDSIGSLKVRGNSGLTSLEGLEKLKHVIFSLEIRDNAALESIELTPFVLGPIAGDILIIDNPQLSSMSGFESLDIIGNLEIRNTSLTEIDAFRDLLGTGSIRIMGNQDLVMISSFRNVLWVGGQLALFDNSSLETIAGFNQLQAIDENFVLASLPRIESLASFSKVDYIGGDFMLYETVVASLNGLGNLTIVEGDLVLRRNDQLQNFCNIQGLLLADGLRGDLVIEENALNPAKEELMEMSCN